MTEHAPRHLEGDRGDRPCAPTSLRTVEGGDPTAPLDGAVSARAGNGTPSLLGSTPRPVDGHSLRRKNSLLNALPPIRSASSGSFLAIR